MKRIIRILLAKPGLDGHLRGINVLARTFREAGMEVIYLGVGLTPEEIGRAAIDEGVDIIGLSIHAGGSVTLVTKLILALKEGGTDEIPILVGGTISKKEKERLREMGVKEIFGPGASLQKIVRCIEGAVVTNHFKS
jgi:methylmalonyl-CoA mutase C-terminal domain/subunit